jgi:hypothetical protein
MGLRRTCSAVRFLGSYPMASATPADPGQVAAERALADRSDTSFTNAAAWLEQIRNGTLLTPEQPWLA